MHVEMEVRGLTVESRCYPAPQSLLAVPSLLGTHLLLVLFTCK